MQIWRKMADGSHPEQMTSDDFNAVSPLSPDGKYLLFLRHSKDLKVLPENNEVALCLLLLAHKSSRILATFVGGQFSLGTQPWLPDGGRVVFISYQSIE
jgi:Tol biopolymer transport system component